MTFLKDITEKRTTPVAMYHRFRVDPMISRRPHVFVEGYDDLQFYPKLLRSSPPKFHVCLGKKKLDEVYKLWRRSTMVGVSVLFIRDSDFDRFLGNAVEAEDYFLTCGYAVENYVCTPKIISNLIRDTFGVDENEIDLDQIEKNFSEIQKKMLSWLTPVFGASLKAISEKRKVELESLVIDKPVRRFLAGKDLPPAREIEGIEGANLTDADFTDASLQLGRQYAEENSIGGIRGKYILTLATEYIKHIADEIRINYKSGNITRFNKRAMPSITEQTVFEALAAAALPTDRLAAKIAPFNH